MRSIRIARVQVVVVEWLTFRVSSDERDVWLAREEEVWSRFLEGCEGFLRKQMWIEEGEIHEIHAVIWWESRELWKRITPEQVVEVDRRMGDLFRDCTMRVYDVIRDC
jgi:uncharacterized protein (TIGR03792 family)